MSAERLPLLLFRIGEVRYGLPIADVREVSVMLKLEIVIGAPDTLLGIANRHGQPLPVLDLRRIMEQPAPAPTADSLFIVAQRGEALLGLLVDEVIQVAYMEAADLRPLHNGGLYVSHLISDGTDLLQIIALETLWAAFAMPPKASALP